MDYARFVRLRQGIWKAFGASLTRAAKRPRALSYGDLEDLALAYRNVLHDHALAAARFPGTAAARLLRQLSLAGTHWLVRSHTEGSHGLGRFFGRTFPRAFRRHLPYLGVAVALFVGSAAGGLVMAAARPSLGLAFLGPQRIAGLEHGHLWTESLVTTSPPSLTSSTIATNNASVAIAAWAGGATAGAFTLYIVLLNGFLLGATTGITLHYSMAGELLTFVSAHGVLELTLILVTSAAGLRVARAIVEAGDRPRGEAVREAGRESLFLLLGCLPWFFLLGWVEAAVSPSPELGAGAKLALGLVLEGAFFAAALLPAPREASDD